MCQLMASSLVSLGTVACSQNPVLRDGNPSRSRNQILLHRHLKMTKPSLLFPGGPITAAESQLGETAEAGRLSWAVTDRATMSLLGLELTE